MAVPIDMPRGFWVVKSMIREWIGMGALSVKAFLKITKKSSEQQVTRYGLLVATAMRIHQHY